jgi:F1F0 ATPase subunit 2
MNLVLFLALSLVAGCVLGIFYFGGLWVTVRFLAASKRPGLLLAGSFLLRTGLLLPAFYLITEGRWERLLACLAGFFIARKCLTSYRRGAAASRTTT